LLTRHPGIKVLGEFVAAMTMIPLGLAYDSLIRFQRSFLYNPNTPTARHTMTAYPDAMNMDFEECVIITQDDAKSQTANHAWLVKQAERYNECPTLIFFHGNAGNISHRLENVHELITTCGCNVLMVEYRGYGMSGGSPSQPGMEKDAKAALEFVKARKDLSASSRPKSIIIFGRSLGGAVAVSLAAASRDDPAIAGIIVENTFTSVTDFVGPLLGLFLREKIVDQWNNYAKIPLISHPLLFLSGRADELVPPFMMNALYDATRSHPERYKRNRFVSFDNGHHNDTFECPGYYKHVGAFIKEVTAGGPDTHPPVSQATTAASVAAAAARPKTPTKIDPNHKR